MIRVLLTLIILLFSYTNVFAQEETYTITVNFTGIKSNKGKLLVGLYDSKKTFLKEQVKGAIVKISNQKATATFNVTAGEYAISAFHDKNDNKKMDTNFFGIPKEDIGTSNDAKGFMGPPKFKDAKFLVTKDKTLIIKIASIF